MMSQHVCQHVLSQFVQLRISMVQSSWGSDHILHHVYTSTNYYEMHDQQNLIQIFIQLTLYSQYNRKMEELNSGLFFAISREDYETAGKLLKAGANPNGIFEVSKGHYISSFNLFITKASAFGFSKGPSNAQYRACIALMKPFLERSTLECKCLKEHKCPLFIALQTFKITNEDQILQHKCDLLRHLIISGATIKFQNRQDSKSKPGKWTLKWFDLEGIRSYLITKNFKYVETKV